ncbi:DUF535 family protein [Methylosinus sp. KRF6]|uniref:DUF535 family protein n=1 Tax=Methylosinus sp. KRF6 TaxID=2846853 RepID=UPI001C0AEEE8|nr:VirK/YbjX family protein [Methylosinus sp. KRF6]
MQKSIQTMWRRVSVITANDSPLQAGVFLLSSLRDTRASAIWLTFLESIEDKYPFGAAPTQLIKKPFFNYVIYHLSLSQRAAILMDHYRLLDDTIPSLIAVSWGIWSVDVGLLRGKNGEIYRLSLRPAEYCHKEGELSFVLSDAADGLELAKLTFVLGKEDDGAPCVLIGGLQGPSSHCGPDTKVRIVKATRALWGLRPKMAVFLAMATFARAIGAQRIHAVSNDTHSINADAWWQRRRMRADYDAFWLERGGLPAREGFVIPVRLAAKSQSKRREEQRAHIDELVGRLFMEKLCLDIDIRDTPSIPADKNFQVIGQISPQAHFFAGSSGSFLTAGNSTICRRG